jgi:membrane protein DedA with SNARE-associated domain
MKNWIQKYKGIILLIAVFLSLNLLLFFISPDEIVESVGVSNTYLAVFLISAIGGVNSITGGILYVSIAAFASGGASPWLLGLCGGLGIAIGDSLMFYLFRYTSKTLSVHWQEKVDRMRKRLEHLSSPVQIALAYLYLGFSPFPNDLLMFLLAVLKFRFVQVFPLILIGALTTATLTAFLGDKFQLFGS